MGWGFLKPRQQKFVAYAFIFSLLGVMAVAYTNCGDVKMMQTNLSSTMPDNPEAPLVVNESLLKPPQKTSGQLRIAVLVDMSRSMVQAKCREEIGGSIANIACSSPQELWDSAADGRGFRFEIIKKWLDAAEADPDIAARTKVLLVPFSGGRSETSESFQWPKIYLQTPVFESLAGTRATLAKIKRKQDLMHQHLFPEAASSPPASWTTTTLQPPQPTEVDDVPFVFGTSVPVTRWKKLKTVLDGEITQLSTNNQLADSHLEILVLSEGSMNPTADNFKTAIKTLWAIQKGANNIDQTQCAQKCGAVLDSMFTGTEIFDPNCSKNADRCEGYQPTIYKECFQQEAYVTACSVVCGATGCVHPQGPYYRESGDYFTFGGWVREMLASWGDYTKNKPSLMAREVLRAKTDLELRPEMTYNIRYLKFTAPPTESGPLTNWLLRLSTDGLGNLFEVAPDATEVPVAIPGLNNGLQQYRIKQLMAFNLNVRVSSGNRVELDSDGDGLNDTMEIAAGLNPQNARTDGKCLDILRSQNKCLPDNSGCHALTDLDGDGLNSCEEIAVGTSDLDFDSDADGIPDSIEVIMQSNPNWDDRTRDSNNDGVSNYQSLIQGVHPMPTFSAVEQNAKLSLMWNFTQMRSPDPKKRGEKMVPAYKAYFTNVPFLAGRGASAAPEMYFSRSRTPDTKHTHRLIGHQIADGSNKLLLLMKVENIQNPRDVYWQAQTYDLSKSNGQSIDLANLYDLRTKDPQGEQ